MSFSDSCSVPLSVRSETKEKFDALFRSSKRIRKSRKNRSTSKEKLIDDEATADVVPENEPNADNYILNKFLHQSAIRDPIQKENRNINSTVDDQNGVRIPPVPIPRRSKQKVDLKEKPSPSLSQETYKVTTDVKLKEKPSPTPSQETFKVTSPKIVKNSTRERERAPSPSSSSLASNKTYNIEKNSNKIGDIVVHKIAQNYSQQSDTVVTIVQTQISVVEKGDIETLSDSDNSTEIKRHKPKPEKKNTKSESIELQQLKNDTITIKNDRKKSIEEDTFNVSEEIQENKEFLYDRITEIIIHKTDNLRLDSLLVHPLVKIHVVNSETGRYFNKSDGKRPVVFYYENENCDFISPVMTQAFNLQDKRSMFPNWEEGILLNEDFEYFMKEREKMIIFFELLDFLPTSVIRQTNQQEGWHYVAFAFLKMSYPKSTNKMLRLQLYNPPNKSEKNSNGQQCSLWCYWKNKRLKKYPSTIYVTVKSVPSPKILAETLRSKFPIQPENSSKTVESLFTASDAVIRTESKFSKVTKDNTEQWIWSRKPWEKYKIPNRIYEKFDAGEDGCFVMKFSNDGKLLACAVRYRNLYCIMLISVLSLKQVGKYPCHQNLIHSIKWSQDNSLIVTASADNTISIFDVNALSVLQILPHPSFVHVCDLDGDDVIVSGCYDKTLRIWKRTERVRFQYDLCEELEGHRGYITALAFGKNSTIFSADSIGVIVEWQNVEDEWKFSREVQVLDLKETVINQIILFAKDKRMLIHSRDSTLRIIDVRTSCVLQWLRGAFNQSVQTFCSISPCESYAFSGCENGKVNVWSTKTGKEVATFRPNLCENDTNTHNATAIHCVTCHPSENMLAMSSYGENVPILLYIHDSDRPNPESGIELTDDDCIERSGTFPPLIRDRRSAKKRDKDDNGKSLIDPKSVLRKMDQVFMNAD